MNSDEKQCLGNKNPTSIINYLREIEDFDAVDALELSGGTGQAFGLNWGSQVWGHTGVLIGFIPPNGNDRLTEIENAYTLPPVPGLKGSRIKISLERFWVQRYPGSGPHEILCEFTGKNQAQDEQEEMQFALKVEANDNASAAVSGAPIFLGVTVGKNGISFEGKTINVRSKTDEELLAVLNGGTFREGLGLLTTVQPALKPFVGLASSVVKSVLSRSKNKQIQFFKLGLDFSDSQTSVALRHGSFVVIQADDADWDWQNIRWNAAAQQVVRSHDNQPLGYNYLIFRVSPFEE